MQKQLQGLQYQWRLFVSCYFQCSKQSLLLWCTYLAGILTVGHICEHHVSVSPSRPLALPRLACALILESKWGSMLALFGVCCSTWISMSRGSTFRSIFLPMGDPHGMAVYLANKSMSRMEGCKLKPSPNFTPAHEIHFTMVFW